MIFKYSYFECLNNYANYDKNDMEDPGIEWLQMASHFIISTLETMPNFKNMRLI